MKLGYITDFFAKSYAEPRAPARRESPPRHAASHSQKRRHIANIGVVASHAP